MAKYMVYGRIRCSWLKSSILYKLRPTGRIGRSADRSARSITSNQVCSHQTSPSVIKDGNVIHLRLKLQLQELAKNREFRRMFISAPFPAFKLKQKLIFNYHKIQVQIAKNEQLG
jgi:hypothetical protein